MVFSSSPAVMERISFPPYPAVAMIVSASQASNKRQFGNKYFLKMTIMKKYISSQSKQPVLLLPFLVPWDPLQAKRLRTLLLRFPQICVRFFLSPSSFPFEIIQKKFTERVPCRDIMPPIPHTVQAERKYPVSHWEHMNRRQHTWSRKSRFTVVYRSSPT